MDIKKTALFFAIMVITVGCISNPSAVTPTENIDIQPATSTPPSVYKFAITTGTINSDWYAEGNRLSLEINAQIPN